MGLYINDKKRFLELCEDLFDNGNSFVVLGYDKNEELRIDVNNTASEVSLGRMLFEGSYSKLFGCGLDYYTDMVEGKIQGGGKITCKDNIDWEQRRYEIARELMPHFLSLWLPDKNGKWEVRHNKEIAAKESVSYADALIEQLKKASNED